MFRRSLKITLNIFACHILFASIIYGQTAYGIVEGIITDEVSGKNISGATVVLEDKTNSNGYKKSDLTNENGYFNFAGIPAGIYQITVSKEFFNPREFDVQVKTDNKTIVKYSLKIQNDSSFKDNLSEKSGSFFPTASSSSAVVKELREILPSKTTFSSLLKISPYIRQEMLSGNFQTNGSTGAENTFFIDGLEVTNYRSGLLAENFDLPFELIQEVSVKTNGFNAESFGAFGGVININTSGDNYHFRGNLGISFTPIKLQGSPNTVLNRFGSQTGQFENFQPGKDGGLGVFPFATFSGPIINEKLWFFSAYTPQIYKTTRRIDYFSGSGNPNNREINQTIEYEQKYRTEFQFFRIDSQPFYKLRLFGTYLNNPIDEDGRLPNYSEGLSGVLPTSGNLTGADFLAQRGGRQNSNLINGQATWNLLYNLIINFQAGRAFLNEKLNTYGIPKQTRFLCSSAGDPGNYPGSDCSGGFNTGENYQLNYDVSKRTTFNVNSSFLLSNLFGRHIFKSGYQFNRLFNEIDEGYFDTGYVVLYYGIPISNLIGLPATPGNLGSGFMQRYGVVGESENTNQALFVQDSWTIKNRLTLNVGVRFENESLPEFNEIYNIKFGWRDKFSPRFGFTFDLLGDGRNKIFGGYGWIYDRLKYNAGQNIFDLSPEKFYRDYFEILPDRGASYTNYTYRNILGNEPDSPGGRCPINNGGGWSVCQISFRIPSQIAPTSLPTPVVDPNIKPARMSEYTIGFEKYFPGGFLFSTLYVHKQIDRAIEDIGQFNEQGSEIYILGNPGYGIVCTVAANANLPCKQAERDFDAVEFAVYKRSESYFFNVNYTYSRLFGNYSGLASSDEFGRVSPNATRYFDLPPMGFDANGNPDNGRLATDRPHVLKAFGGYTFDWKNNNVNQTTVSAYTTFQSGTPLTTIYNLYNLNTSILFERGDLGRTEMFSQTDLLVNHRFLFGNGNRFAFEPYFVILNLFDERNQLSRQTSISSTNFTAGVLTAGGCTTCQSEAAVFNTIFNEGGIRQFVMNYLNSRGTSSTGIRNDYNQPNLFQEPRYFRFGVKFSF